MTGYTIRRLLLLIPTWFVVSLIVFFSIRLIPGDIIDFNFASVLYLPPEKLDEIRHEMGLDRPAYLQYFSWLGGVLRGDLGDSLFTGKPVLSQILKRLPVSAEIAVVASGLGMLIALPIGILSAVKRNSILDYLGRGVAIAGLSVPNFVLATLVVLLPVLWWGWAAPMEYKHFWQDPWVNIQQIFPAALALGVRLSSTAMRMTRSTMLEVLREDYVRTARAKGLPERVVIVRHALKNALIPVVTIWGGSFAFLLGGTVIIETIFGLPGVGQLTIDAINRRDYTQFQGNVLFLATVFVVVNFLVDMSYSLLDPRIRYDRR
ncbi:MAG: ABC transporter permease [Chloroflexi bacterium]|nr:ABC transporter permease [Chloroflexota bacterium]